ncbi:MAG TPA: MFS transporter [Candidatus Limnocylindrales bacterium]|nr:MFS transporter [Candidatus Limnocylindrales bacterium]
MARGPALVLLVVLCVGAFLTGLELMVTAVALPAIVENLASWTELRKASWIVNAYLLTTIVTMPIAGRLSDRWGVRRPFLGALLVFGTGSVLAGAAQSLDQLIAARVVQSIGGGFLVPVATAATSHLFEGRARPRALGLIGAVTFLGMAAGPFVGAAVLAAVHPADALEAAGLAPPLLAALDAPWRYVFYLNVPIAVAGLGLAWAAFGTWDTPRGAAVVDAIGAVLVTAGLTALLVGLTLAGSSSVEELAVDPWLLVAALVIGGLAVAGLGLWLGARRGGPLLDPAWFRSRAFGSAVVVSALTGYAFATAVIGGAVFVDRVLYGGPDVQRVALGSLALATAAGALGSGLVLRVVGLRLTTLAGIGLGLAGLWRMSAWTPASSIGEVAGWLAVFGLGFGLTVTPRSTAAVEALGREAFGIASAIVTVAREVGMAIGLAVLTAFGSTVIDRLSSAVYATPDAYKAFIPLALRDRPLKDGLVVQALETWASGEAATILVGIFVVAAAVLAVAILPTLALEGRDPTTAPSRDATARTARAAASER